MMYAWKNVGKVWFLGCVNVFGQSDCRIFKWIISLERKDEKALFFAFWDKFIEIKSWLKNIGMGMVINRCAYSGCWNLKLLVSHKEINGINWKEINGINSENLKVTLIIGPPPYRGSYKIKVVCLSSICLSIHPSVLHFPQERHISFFWFLTNNWNI